MAIDPQNPPFLGSQVLPRQSSSPMELALADVAADNILPIDVPIDTLWDPAKCPEEFLPFLAWALSVDVWDPDWPLETKRRAIAASPEIHRRKGTRYAVRTALEAIGMSPTITEWWQASPPARRGTFSVTIYINEQIFAGLPVINERMQILAKAAIRASKPKSRVYDFKVGVKYKTSLHVTSVMAPPLTIERQTLSAKPLTDFANRVGVIAAMSPLNIIKKTVTAKPGTAFKKRLGITAIGTSLQILRFKMEGSVI